MRLIGISTHTSRVGCDHRKGEVNLLGKFLLTHPVWDVTFNEKSILRTDSEFLLTHPVWDVTCFPQNGQYQLSFLLTHPVWDVTKNCNANTGILCISTHTSRVGCDHKCAWKKVI